jgi:peptidoglycan-N-acetylglucosamine deacetylase
MKRKVASLAQRSSIAEKLRFRLYSALPGLYPGALCRLSRHDAVALTLDDGPSERTRDLLAVLRREGLAATFFLSGTAVAAWPDLPRAIRDEGHAIASHGYAHVSPLWWSRGEVAHDIAQSVSLIEKNSGTRPLLYRPPYGQLHPMHHRVPGTQGCRLVLWNVFIGDYDSRIAATELQRRLVSVRGGDILLLHDQPASFERTAACLRLLAEILRNHDLETMTL